MQDALDDLERVVARSRLSSSSAAVQNDSMASSSD
jgi:hypothetical protein